MSFSGTLIALGEVAIVIHQVDEIIHTIEEIMDGVNEIISDIVEMCEGQFIDKMKDAASKLATFVKDLIQGVADLVEIIRNFMNASEENDNNAGAKLLELIQRK